MRSISSMLMSLSLLALSCGGGTSAPVVGAPAAPNGYELRLGKEVFRMYCAGCHGESGAGDGFNAYNLDPHPRDLGDQAFQKSKSDADLTEAIRRGGAGVGLTSLMPPWGHTIDERHTRAVVLYLRSLRR